MTQANALPVNVNRAIPPTVRVDRAPPPSYDGEVVWLHVPLTNVSARVVSWVTASLKALAGRQAPTLPARSVRANLELVRLVAGEGQGRRSRGR